MKVGFTGTQHSMTASQYRVVMQILLRLDMHEFHHGDCIGADKEANDIVETERKTVRIHVHPPEDPRKRAYCTAEDTLIHTALPYLERNKVIVESVDLLIAAPYTVKEMRRSGTWMTIRYAKKQHVCTLIVWPDGERYESM